MVSQPLGQSPAHRQQRWHQAAELCWPVEALQGRQGRDVKLMPAGTFWHKTGTHNNWQPARQAHFDVANHVALGILRYGRAPVGANPPVQQHKLLLGEPLDGDMAQQCEASATDHFLLQRGQLGAQPRKREIVLLDVLHAMSDCQGCLKPQGCCGEAGERSGA